MGAEVPGYVLKASNGQVGRFSGGTGSIPGRPFTAERPCGSRMVERASSCERCRGGDVVLSPVLSFDSSPRKRPDGRAIGARCAASSTRKALRRRAMTAHTMAARMPENSDQNLRRLRLKYPAVCAACGRAGHPETAKARRSEPSVREPRLSMGEAGLGSGVTCCGRPCTRRGASPSGTATTTRSRRCSGSGFRTARCASAWCKRRGGAVSAVSSWLTRAAAQARRQKRGADETPSAPRLPTQPTAIAKMCRLGFAGSVT
jgi:hypothetical protein